MAARSPLFRPFASRATAAIPVLLLAVAGLSVATVGPASPAVLDPAASDLALDVTSRARASTGEALPYKTRVTNDGPDAAPATLTLAPEAPPYVTVTTDTGTCAPMDTQTSEVVCDLGSLAAGDTALVRAQVPYTTPGTVPFTATVSTTGSDVISSNNSETFLTSVSGDACTAVGTAAGDTLTGTIGADVLCGFAGPDKLAGLAGDDQLLGGQGLDLVNYDTASGPVDVNLTDGTSHSKTGDGDAGFDTLVSIASARGSQWSDTLEGSEVRNLLSGYAGPDEILGHGGDDLLSGQGGDDAIYGGSGIDQCAGGNGNNTLADCEPWLGITSISPPSLVPSGSATLTGGGFSPNAADNTVTIGGASATVTGATATTLTVTVPCVASGDRVDVKATVNGTDTNVFEHPLQVTQRDLDVGEAAILTDASEVGCNEISSADGAARYQVAAYNVSTNPTASAGIQLSADATGAVPVTQDTRRGSAELAGPGSEASADLVLGEHGAELPEPSGSGDAHLELMKSNRAQYKLLREEFGTEGVSRRGVQRDVTAADMPLTRNFRVSNINVSNICNSYYVASATRVYAEGKLVIYEDDATPTVFKAANSPKMADYYDRIGDQFNADMEPIIRNNFGDILRRDAVTDNNGVMVAVSTPRINTSFSGVAGFVVSCDQFPNDDANTPAAGGPYTGSGVNGASNFGEYFYVYQPVTNSAGYSGNTPDNWYRTIRSTFIHESKHVASMAARVANDAPAYEAAWLEEGTARHAEELWARGSVYNVPWKGNTGYGSANAPNSIYCDVRPDWSECVSNPRGPASIMQRHFTSLYTNLFGTNSRLLSPFGRTPSDNASYFYATSWSLVRYAIDRYGTSDAEFLTALTQSTSTGATNLSAQSGVSTEQLLGRWALALSVDDYPGMTASDDVKMPTWNFRDIYAGLNRDFPATYTLAYPSQPENHAFGSSFSVDEATIYGGGVRMFQFSGTQTQGQLLRLRGNGGGTLPSSIRMAIVRVE